MRFLRRGREGTRRGLLAGLTVVTLLGVAPGAHAAISVSDASVTEGNAGQAQLTFTITDSDIVCGETVRVSTAAAPAPSATAGVDYVAVQDVAVTIPGGLVSCSTTTTVAVQPDLLDELDEQLVLETRTTANGPVLASGTGTITDDDLPPTVSIAAGSAAEGTASASAVALPVTLSAPSGRTVTVPYTITPGTATTPDDIDATAGSVTITAGQTVGAVSVPTVADGIDEADETFTVTLGTPTNATPGTTTAATGTVTNDDAPVVTIAGLAAAEGTAASPTTFSFPITLSNPGRGPVTVRVRSADVQAKAPGDYAAVDQVVTFAAGETAKSVPVGVVADAVREPDEAFTMTLSEVTGGTLGTAVALGAIQNDDAAVATPTPTGTTGGGTVLTPSGGGPTLPPGPIDASQPVVRLTGLTYRRSGARVRVKVTCPASETRCTGAVTIFNVVQPKSKIKILRRESRLARGSFTLAGGASVTLTMKTTAAGKRLLRAVKALKVRAFGVARDPSGNTGIATRSGSFRR